MRQHSKLRQRHHFCALDKRCHRIVTFSSDGANLSSARPTLGNYFMSGFKPEHFINRELSWLEFNQRVLDEALDPTNPLLERLKFFTIVSSNLDEFFEVRVAGLKQQIESGHSERSVDGQTASETFQAIARRAHQMVADQYVGWR